METLFWIILWTCIAGSAVAMWRDFKAGDPPPPARVSEQRLARLWIIDRHPLEQELRRGRD